MDSRQAMRERNDRRRFRPVDREVYEPLPQWQEAIIMVLVFGLFAGLLTVIAEGIAWTLR